MRGCTSPDLPRAPCRWHPEMACRRRRLEKVKGWLLAGKLGGDLAGRRASVFRIIGKYGVTGIPLGSVVLVEQTVASVGPKEGLCAADHAPCLSGYCCRWW